MLRTLKQSISDYEIPNYVIEILTNNYCPSFMKMSIIKENDSYRFSYNTDFYGKINYKEMNTVNKLRLIKSVISRCKLADEYLIPGSMFLVEPELVMSRDNGVGEDRVQLLFYPDKEQRNQALKIGALIEKIRDKYNRQESEVLDAACKMAGNSEWVKLERYIDKNIDRLVN